MKKLIAIFLSVTLLLSGCGYGTDVDGQSFVIAVGIDKGEVYPLRLTFVFANPSGSSGGDKSPSAPKPDSVSVEAPTIFSAVKKLDAIKSKEINLTHTKIVIFSEETAKKGIGKFLSGFASSRDFRPNTYVCVSKGKAQNYLSSVKPSQEEFIEKYYDHIMQKVASDKVNEAYLYYLFFNVSDKFSGSLVPLVGVNDNKFPESQDHLYTDSDDFSYEARAGEIVREAENKAEILGSAILRNDKMVGTLGSFDTDLSRMICGEYYPRNYSIAYPGKSDYVTIRIIQQSDPDVSTKIKNGNAVIDITVPVSIEYVDAGKIGNSEKKSLDFCNYLENELNFRCEKLIRDAQDKYKSDFLGLGDNLKRHFPDMTAWENFNWEEKFVSSEINISFKVVFADFEETN